MAALEFAITISFSLSHMEKASFPTLLVPPQIMTKPQLLKASGPMLDMLPVSFSVTKLSQEAKAREAIVVVEAPPPLFAGSTKVTFVNAVHCSKAEFSMVVTVPGISTAASLEPKKALVPIVVMLLGMVT